MASIQLIQECVFASGRITERVSGQHGDSDGVLQTPRILLEVCFQAM